MPHYVAYFLDNSGPESEKAIFHIAVKHDLMASYYKVVYHVVCSASGMLIAVL
jgi:hypothetical protein